ncbi:hypothetical protein B6D25_06495, partial [Micrococcus luteus]
GGGPRGGGGITARWGWGWTFCGAGPLPVVALVRVRRTLHLPHRERQKVSIDYLGIVFLTVMGSFGGRGGAVIDMSQ